MKRVTIGFAGFGNIGTTLAKMIIDNQSRIAHEKGVHLEINRALVKDIHKSRPNLPVLLTDNPSEVLSSPEINLIVELTGTIEPARLYISEALDNGKHVITANKSVMAIHGRELLDRARTNSVSLRYEAAVGACIPVLCTLHERLAGNHLESIHGILNGTTNYILYSMYERGLTYEAALQEAQTLGFAEPDPSFDLSGRDALQKLILMVRLGFGVECGEEQITCRGIESISGDDIDAAKEMGFVIKLIASAQNVDGSLRLTVAPALIPEEHALAHVPDSYNAVLIRGDAVGDLLLYGMGAGPLPTANAVLSDLLLTSNNPTAESIASIGKGLVLAKSVPAKYYLRIPIEDRPGAIGHVGTILGDCEISISRAQAILSKQSLCCGQVRILTHEAEETSIQRACERLEQDPEVRGRISALPIIESSLKHLSSIHPNDRKTSSIEAMGLC